MKTEKQIEEQIFRLQKAKNEHDLKPPGYFSSQKAKIKHAHFSALFDNDIKTLQWVLRDYLPVVQEVQKVSGTLRIEIS